MLRFNATVQGQSATLPCSAGLFVVYDRFPAQGAAIPSFANVFSAPLSPTTFMNITYQDRFELLHREMLTFPTFIAAAPTDKMIQKISFDLDLGGRPTILTTADSTGILSNMVRGSLLIYMNGDYAFANAAIFLQNSIELLFSDE